MTSLEEAKKIVDEINRLERIEGGDHRERGERHEQIDSLGKALMYNVVLNVARIVDALRRED